MRFPPGFFKPADDYFWSYPIFYWLEGDVLASPHDLERALRSYDAGLYGGRFPAGRIQISFEEKPAGTLNEQPFKAWLVRFDGFDPFATKKPLRTHLSIRRVYVRAADRTAIMILRSPRRYRVDDPVWIQLEAFWNRLELPK